MNQLPVKIQDAAQHKEGNITMDNEEDITTCTIATHQEQNIKDDEGSTIHCGAGGDESWLRLIFRTWWSKVMGDIYAQDDDPVNFSRLKKNIIIFIVAYGGLMGPTAAMIYLPGMQQVMSDLSTSVAGVNGTVAAYVVFLGISPVFWGCMSDVYGRKPLYVISSIIALIAAIICAVSKNIVMLIIFRAIQASGAGAGQTLGAGVISDTFEVANRGKAYGIFYIGPLFGPVVGPTIGGALCQFLGWRSTLYFTSILGFVFLLIVIFLLPETARKKQVTVEEVIVTSSNNNQQEIVVVKKMQGSEFMKTLGTIFSPMLVMLGDPTVIIITIFNTVPFACLYFLGPTITEVFSSVYHYNSWQVGLCYLLMGAGLVCGSIFSGQYADIILRQLRAKKGQDNLYPEMRLRAAFPSFLLLPAGALIYGWSVQKQVPVYAPFIGLFVYALGQMNATTPTSVYLVDSKPGRSASAMAINNFVRYIVAAIVTIFSSSCLDAAGPGLLFTILAAITVANIALLLLVLVYGKKWRTSFEKRTGTGPPPINKA